MAGYIKFALSLSALSRYRYLGDGGTDRREILVHIGGGQVFFPFGGCSIHPSFIPTGIPKSEILGLNFDD